MADRGNVKYTEPDTFNEGDIGIKAQDIKDICEIIRTNLKEIHAIRAVQKNATTDYSNRRQRLGQIDPDVDAELTTTQLNARPGGVVIVTAELLNSLVRNGNLLSEKVNEAFTEEQLEQLRLLNGGEYLSHEVLSKLCENLRNTSIKFDSVNSMWDANNFCKISCQVRCQYTCQLSCQSCYTGTCHNQNCGGWS